MGGTGVAFLNSAGAIPTNAALLDQIGKLTVTVAGYGMWNQHEKPFLIDRVDASGGKIQNYETTRNEGSGGNAFGGVAYRLHERVVVGLAAYPNIGMVPPHSINRRLMRSQISGSISMRRCI